MNWTTILRHYDAHHRQRAQREHEWFANSTSLEEAICHAALAIDHRGKRLSHQRRINRHTLVAARDALLHQNNAIANAPDFATLHHLVTSVTHDIHGLGELYRYDTALRIGAYRQLQPTTVYLHAGTRTGARALHLKTNRATIDPDELPHQLRCRSPQEIEDILCIYKKQFHEPTS